MGRRMLNLDDLIEKSIKSQTDKIIVPPKEEVWVQITHQLERQRAADKRKRRAVKFIAASIALILYLGTIPMIFPDPEAKAVGRRLVEIFQSVFRGETRVETISREKAPPLSKEAPPPGDQVPVDTIGNLKPKIFVNLEEARKIIPFAFRIPKYIPEGYHLENIAFSSFGKESGEVVLHYKSGESEIKIFEVNLPDDFATSSTVRTEEATIQKVDINGVKGTLTLFTNGFSELEYYASGISIRIGAKVDTKEIMEIGKSMQ